MHRKTFYRYLASQWLHGNISLDEVAAVLDNARCTLRPRKYFAEAMLRSRR